MKFKDTQIGDRLTVWQLSQRLYVLKISADAAVNLATGEMIHIHKNKDVDYTERLTPDQQLGTYQGETVACRKMDVSHIEIIRVIVIGGAIVKKGEVRIMEHKKKDLSQVYIIMNVMRKKLHELEAMFQTVEVLIEEATGGESGQPNYIMSTAEPVNAFELPGE